jgi:hypothetical protein
MRFVAGSFLVVAIATAILPACSQGQGDGAVTGTLDVPDCWSGAFNLHPNFFAAVPNTNSIGVQATTGVQIRIQNGSDFEGFSDGLLITVYDAGQVRGDPLPNGTPRPSLLGEPLVVSELPGVVAPGVPVVAVPNPPIVSASIYLNHTCSTVNQALYALSAVSLGPNGECGGGPPLACSSPSIAIAGDGGTVTGEGGATDASTEGGAADGGSEGGTDGGGAPLVGQSTITFTSLFDGNANEPNAAARLTDATFEFFLADPREGCPGGLGPPPPCRGHLVGNFHFYFQRGRPAQPFP